MEGITIQNVSLSFAEETVLDDITLSLEKGKIYGLVGRNGSGKTVLMKCICGFFRPDKGEIFVNQRQVSKDMDFPENLGILIEAPGFLGGYSGYENLKMLAMLRGKIKKPEIYEAMESVELNPKLKKSVSKYSLGMKQRLGIAQAIMENPDIVILDEPMNGLDTSGIAIIRELILGLKSQGKLIILSSHNQEDIDALCDEVFYLEKGRIVKADIPQ